MFKITNFSKSYKYCFVVLSVLVGSVHCVSAKDLGLYGAVYPISEPNLITQIQETLIKYKKTGKMKVWENNFKKKVKEHVIRPEPVKGITTTNNPKIFYYKPTFTLQHDVYDTNGMLLYPKGLTVNPLDTKTYPKQSNKSLFQIKYKYELIFIDGDDGRQITWAMKETKRLDKLKRWYKVILVNGSIVNGSKELKTYMYFDQGGFLSKKFNISHVPTVVNQDKTRFKLQEFDVSNERNYFSFYKTEKGGNDA